MVLLQKPGVGSEHPQMGNSHMSVTTTSVEFGHSHLQVPLLAIIYKTQTNTHTSHAQN